MENLHNIRRTGTGMVLWYGPGHECQNESHIDTRYQNHENCLREMYGIDPYSGTHTVWYCECYICYDQQRNGNEALQHIFLHPYENGDATTPPRHDYTETGYGGRSNTYVCQNCRDGIHARDVFPHIPVHEHRYDNWGGCECEHYDATFDFGGHEGDFDNHVYNDDGRCTICLARRDNDEEG